MFLGLTASIANWDADGTECSLILEDNALVDFVELPETCQGLYYCNVLYATTFKMHIYEHISHKLANTCRLYEEHNI